MSGLALLTSSALRLGRRNYHWGGGNRIISISSASRWESRDWNFPSRRKSFPFRHQNTFIVGFPFWASRPEKVISISFRRLKISICKKIISILTSEYPDVGIPIPGQPARESHFHFISEIEVFDVEYIHSHTEMQNDLLANDSIFISGDSFASRWSYSIACKMFVQPMIPQL